MKQITIIRIEHPINKKGLFRGRDEDNEVILFQHSQSNSIIQRHSDQSKFPAYSRDKELCNQIDHNTLQNYHFAFLSLDQLKEALTMEELKECIEVLGFKVLMLDVTDYYKSSFQVVFNKESITSYKDISFMFL